MLNSCGGKKDYEELREIINSRTFTKNIKNLQELGVVDVVEEFTTGVNKKYYKAAFIIKPVEEIIEEIEANEIKSIKQIRVLEMLIENEYISTSDIMRFLGVSSSVLNALKKKGYIDYKEIEVKRDPHENTVFEKTFPLEPTREQAAVLERTKKLWMKENLKKFFCMGLQEAGKQKFTFSLYKSALIKESRLLCWFLKYL